MQEKINVKEQKRLQSRLHCLVVAIRSVFDEFPCNLQGWGFPDSTHCITISLPDCLSSSDLHSSWNLTTPIPHLLIDFLGIIYGINFRALPLILFSSRKKKNIYKRNPHAFPATHTQIIHFILCNQMNRLNLPNYERSAKLLCKLSLKSTL